MFSKACEYGIRACVVVAKHSANNERVSIKDISRAINSPEAFTSKILQKLAKNKIVNSMQGVNGGFEINSKFLNTLTLEDIVDTIDGKESYSGCVLGLKECSDNKPCPAHKKYKFIKEDFIKMLQETTIMEMVNDTENGFAFLKTFSK